MNRHRIGVLTCLVLLTSAAFAFAHHSVGAYYDINREVTLKGPVTALEWTNPHTFVHIDVRDAKGNVTNWSIESDSPNSLTRAGWTRTTLRIGDEVTAVGFPSKKGLMELRLLMLQLADGRKLKG